MCLVMIVLIPCKSKESIRRVSIVVVILEEYVTMSGTECLFVLGSPIQIEYIPWSTVPISVCQCLSSRGLYLIECLPQW